MLLIDCPWCGPRADIEFVCAGEAHPPRPTVPETPPDAAWADYITLRENRRGLHAERWWHAKGCGSWLLVTRNTASHEIASVRYLRGQQP